MKKLALILTMAFGLGFYSVQAQDNNMNKDAQDQTYTKSTIDKSDYNGDGVISSDERSVDRADKSKAGKKIDKAGDKSGNVVKRGWGKVKHNKLTKNVFNQPKDE
ncbi:MAG: hypothetical protein K2X86_09940 [Cytophagaceae bacterium]|nr:hypothetical protein [Cytophagaceae bacterium]